MKQVYGKFITVEGIEGVGKSTNIEFIRQCLESKGIRVTVTREPGGTALGEEIRHLLLSHRHDGMADDTELLLMFAARCEHLHQVIRPQLEKGRWVICDRFTDATYAYQGGGRGISVARIAALESWVQGTLQPDMTLLLDVPVATGLSRVSQRQGEADRFETQQQTFFEKVRACYLDRAAAQPQRFRVIDAGQMLEQVQQQLAGVLTTFLQENRSDD